MSDAVPPMPPDGWCIMIRACGSAYRLPCVPAHSRNWPIDAAMPIANVATSLLDELHGVVDRHAGVDRATGRVDVEVDVALGVLRGEQQQLGADPVGDLVVHLAARGR